MALVHGTVKGWAQAVSGPRAQGLRGGGRTKYMLK